MYRRVSKQSFREKQKKSKFDDWDWDHISYLSITDGWLIDAFQSMYDIVIVIIISFYSMLCSLGFEHSKQSLFNGVNYIIDIC